VELFYGIEERLEEEAIEIMTETMEQYMSKTRGNYASGVARPKINDKTHFEFKGQFLKELRENTFSGSEHEDANEHIEKVLEIVDLFHIPEVIQDQIMLRSFPMLDVSTRHILDSKGAIPTKTAADAKDCPLKEEGKTLEKAYYTQFGAPYQPGGQYRAVGQGPNPRDHVKSISTGKADSTGIRRIGSCQYAVSDSRYSNLFSGTVPFPNRLHGYCCDWMEAHEVKILETYDHTLPQKEKDPGSFTLLCFIHNVCFNKTLVDLGASVSVMPFSTYTNLGLGDLAHTRLTIELVDRIVKHPRGIAENVLVSISKIIFPIDFIILDIPEDDNVPLILE
ncbi:DNA/RNA polymerases superfamily protein, partial [Tanacetum coccineum]